MKWWDQMARSSFFKCWILSQLSCFSLIKGLFSFSSFSAIRVVSYLRLLIFLLVVLFPACESSSLAFHMMCSACELNMQGDNVQPWCTPFPVLNQSVVPCLVLTCFLTHLLFSQEREKIVWYSYLFKNFPQFVVIHTVKGFSAINEAVHGCSVDSVVPDSLRPHGL